jgi:hypothetical protein
MGQAALAALAKSGFTAAFALIFVSEIGDKTFFIAALLAMRLGRAVLTSCIVCIGIGALWFGVGGIWPVTKHRSNGIPEISRLKDSSPLLFT